MGFFQRLLGKVDTQLILDKEPSKPDAPVRKAEDYLQLMQLQESRQLLEVRSDNGKTRHQSLVLAVDIERGLLWIDELFPQQHLLDVGDLLVLRHHRKGEELIIESRIVAFGNQFGTQGIALYLPEQIQWQPRRRQTRFGLSGAATLVKIRTLGAEPCYGKLQDISTGGFSVSLSGNLLGQLRHGALLPLCEITLDNQINIRCRGRVCAFRIEREPFRCTRICVQFVDLPEKTLIELMNCLERLSQHDQPQIAA